MPEERNDGASGSASKDSCNPKELKDTEEVKAIITPEIKMMDNKAAGGEEEKPAYDTQAFKEKVGPCPLCEHFHYYESRKGKTKGQILVSAFLSLCPKYITADVDTRADELFLEGRSKLTSIMKACDQTAQAIPQIHHDIALQDRYGIRHKVRCIKVEHITEPQQ